MGLPDRAPFVCYARFAVIHQLYSRAVLPGGTFPGPVIRGYKGDRFKINVINRLTDGTMLRSTSIVRPNEYRSRDFMLILKQHWHGIYQDKESNWADGVSFVTQCPIAANNSFLYDFRTSNQAGTFWYHSHLCKPLVLSTPFRAHKSHSYAILRWTSRRLHFV